MAKYLDPKADLTFKKVFGEHKNLVISFLNALLPLDKGKKIKSIEYLPSEMPPRTPFSKDTIVDVRCEETGGRKFIVEMQMNWTANFKQRVLFNAAKAYVRQMPKGKKYHLLQPVYSLNLVNDTFEPEMDGYYHYYSLVHYLNSKKTLDGLHLVFIELPKFKAKNLTEKKMQILWLRFLTEIDRDGADDVSQDLLDNPQTGEALEIVRESGLNDVERAACFHDADGDDSVLERVQLAADERLQRADDLSGGDRGVVRLVRRRAVSAFARDPERPAVAARHHRTGTVAQHAVFQRRPEMGAEDGLNAGKRLAVFDDGVRALLDEGRLF